MGFDRKVVLSSWLQVGALGEKDVAGLIVDGEQRRVGAVQHFEPGGGARAGGGALTGAVQRTRHTQVVVRRLGPKHWPWNSNKIFGQLGVNIKFQHYFDVFR